MKRSSIDKRTIQNVLNQAYRLMTFARSSRSQGLVVGICYWST